MFVLFFLNSSPVVVIYFQDCLFIPLKCCKVFFAKAKFLADPTWNCVLDHFSQGTVILSDPVLVLGKLYKVVDGLAVWGERDCNNSIFIIVLQ